MKKSVLVAIVMLIALLWGNKVDQSQLYLSDAPITVITLGIERDFAAKYKAWFQACDYTPYSCIGVKVPKVVAKYMRRGMLGQYDGSDTVFVNRTLRGQRLNEVLMHEMIHYLQKQVGGLVVPGLAKDICAAEEEAFTTVDRWLLDHGYKDLMIGPRWWEPYSWCHEWYGPKRTRARGGWFGFIR